MNTLFHSFIKSNSWNKFSRSHAWVPTAFIVGINQKLEVNKDTIKDLLLRQILYLFSCNYALFICYPYKVSSNNLLFLLVIIFYTRLFWVSCSAKLKRNLKSLNFKIFYYKVLFALFLFSWKYSFSFLKHSIWPTSQNDQKYNNMNTFPHRSGPRKLQFLKIKQRADCISCPRVNILNV